MAMTRSEKKTEGPYFLESLKPDLMKITLAPSLNPELQFLVGIFDLDDCSIDQHADGNGNPGQGHDVGVEPHHVHGNERKEHGNRNGNDRNQG